MTEEIGPMQQQRPGGAINAPGDAVGYGKPPKQHRFKRGQSGNPKGRPKGSKSFKSMVHETLSKTIWIHDGKGRRQVTRLEAVLMKQLDLALRGDQKAVRDVLATVKLVGLLEDMPASQENARYTLTDAQIELLSDEEIAALIKAEEIFGRFNKHQPPPDKPH